MALVALVSLVVALILVGIGVAVGLVACALGAVLLGLGVISSSFVIGIRSGRAADGVRAFLLQCGLIAGVPAGAVCAMLAGPVFASVAGNSDWLIAVYGGLGGALAGVVIALSLDWISRRLHRWALERLPFPGGVQAKAIPPENP